jgi:uncharacterized protein YecE (DUF72 family)
VKLLIGCCGIPSGLVKYSGEFEVVELDSTFYKLPKTETARKWRENVPKGFIFTVKCHRAVTHPVTSPTWKRSGVNDYAKLKDRVDFLKPTAEVFDFWRQTLEICRTLKSPVCLIQLPASFRETEENKRNAQEFLSKTDRADMTIALELRGWSRRGFGDVCERCDLTSCVDSFKEGPVWLSESKVAYLRLHGSYEKNRLNYKHRYSRRELEELKNKLGTTDAKEIYCLFNNLWMRDNALEFKRMLRI